ncbi:DUF257 family protein [Pyrococcus sp. ST04]|uniref:DUF257 family protein n=1 Tax=Pyrococcus sp. ST04 TaxID=1183377 RepID=UPI0014389835|nr:DUF257 family protein [Pyrococcus sp. ST04]
MKAESTSYGPEFFAILLKKYANMRGRKLIIVDMLDTLHVISEHLKVLGFPDAFADVPVIKIGGTLAVGNVIKRISIAGEHVLYVKKYKELLDGYLNEEEGEIMALVIGGERLMALLSKYSEFYQMIIETQKLLGHPKLITISVIDTTITRNLSIDPIPELERIATTVVEAIPKEGSSVLRIEKMPTIGVMKRTIEIVTPTLMSLLLTLKQAHT